MMASAAQYTGDHSSYKTVSGSEWSAPVYTLILLMIISVLILLLAPENSCWCWAGECCDGPCLHPVKLFWWTPAKLMTLGSRSSPRSSASEVNTTEVYVVYAEGKRDKSWGSGIICTCNQKILKWCAGTLMAVCAVYMYRWGQMY